MTSINFVKPGFPFPMSIGDINPLKYSVIKDACELLIKAAINVAMKRKTMNGPNLAGAIQKVRFDLIRVWTFLFYWHIHCVPHKLQPRQETHWNTLWKNKSAIAALSVFSYYFEKLHYLKYTFYRLDLTEGQA